MSVVWLSFQSSGDKIGSKFGRAYLRNILDFPRSGKNPSFDSSLVPTGIIRYSESDCFVLLGEPFRYRGGVNWPLSAIEERRLERNSRLELEGDESFTNTANIIIKCFFKTSKIVLKNFIFDNKIRRSWGE